MLEDPNTYKLILQRLIIPKAKLFILMAFRTQDYRLRKLTNNLLFTVKCGEPAETYFEPLLAHFNSLMNTFQALEIKNEG